MKSISIEAISEQLRGEGLRHQLRDDGKIVFAMATDYFKDVDGDAAIFCVVALPYDNFLTLSGLSLFSIKDSQSGIALLSRLNLYNSTSPIGRFCLSQESGDIFWTSSSYTDGSIEHASLHIVESVVSLAKYLDDLVGGEGDSRTNSDEIIVDQGSEDLLVQRLEQCLSLGSSEEQAVTPPHSKVENESKSNSTISNAEIELSSLLSEESREYAANSLEKISNYLKKIQLALPNGLRLRIQHGNNLENVESGPNKGPYLVVIDSSGKEKRSARFFMSKRGNLNHYVAVSTIVSRA